MSKICVITDTHFGARSDHQAVTKNMLEFFQNQFIPELKSRKIKKIVHCGDLFDKRKGLTTLSVTNFKPVLDLLKEFDIDWIIGNHDTYHVDHNNINSSIFLREYDNLRVFKNATTVKIDNLDICYIPWITTENYDDTMNVIKNTKARIAFGHLEIKGFEFYTGSICKHGLDSKIFENFDSVYSGHFHKKSKSGQIAYLGSPYQTTWQEVYETKGYHILDIETLEMEFVPNRNNLFIEIRDKKELKTLDLTDKFVRIVVSETEALEKEFKEFEENVSEKKPASVTNKIVEKVELKEDFNIDDETFDKMDIVNIGHEYIDSLVNFEYKEELKSVFGEIYKDAVNAQNKIDII